jgi:hypothetical protein
MPPPAAGHHRTLSALQWGPHEYCVAGPRNVEGSSALEGDSCAAGGRNMTKRAVHPSPQRATQLCPRHSICGTPPRSVTCDAAPRPRGHVGRPLRRRSTRVDHWAWVAGHSSSPFTVPHCHTPSANTKNTALFSSTRRQAGTQAGRQKAGREGRRADRPRTECETDRTTPASACRAIYHAGPRCTPILTTTPRPPHPLLAWAVRLPALNPLRWPTIILAAPLIHLGGHYCIATEY